MHVKFNFIALSKMKKTIENNVIFRGIHLSGFGPCHARMDRYNESNEFSFRITSKYSSK